MAQPRFGYLLRQAIQQAKANTGRNISIIQGDLAERCHVTEHAIEKWKKRNLPLPDAVALLAQWGVEEVGMQREWLVAFLQAGEYYDNGRLEQLCFGEERMALPQILENLPPLHGNFIGREEAIERIREGLTLPNPLLSIEGMGGVGKSSLAIRVGHLCRTGAINALTGDENHNSESEVIPPFEVIVWISARDKSDENLSLGEVMDTIAGVHGRMDVRRLTDVEKRPVIDRLLRGRRTLLIVDNFETVTSTDLVGFLQRVPPPSKAIITTRYRGLRRLWDVSLDGLSEEEALLKVRAYAHSLGLRVIAQAEFLTLRPLLQIVGGNPKAIEMALGYVKYQDMGLDQVVHSLAEANENVEELFNDLFTRAWQILSEEARRLLLIMPLFADSASREALEAISEVHGLLLRSALSQLIDMSLLETNEVLAETEKRYFVHPLVMAFARSCLNDVTDFRAQAQERWSAFFLQYVEQYGDEDIGEGLIPERRRKLRIELDNLRLVISWSFQNHPELAVRLVECITTFLLDEGFWPERLTLCQQALELAHTPSSQAGLLTRLGWTHLMQGQYGQAQAAQEEGIKIAQTHGLDERLVQLFRDTGHCHALQGNYGRAQELYEVSLRLAQSLGQEIGILEAKAFRARTAYQSGEYQLAQQELLGLLPTYQHAHPRQLLFAWRILGDIAIAEGQMEEARTYLEKATKHVETAYYEAHEEAQLYRSWGDLEKALGNFEAALQAYNRAFRLSTELGMTVEVSQVEAQIGELQLLLRE